MVWTLDLIGNFTSAFYALREECPNMEYFLVCIFPHSDWIRGDTEYLSVFRPNAGKYGPEKTPSLDTFQAVLTFLNACHLTSSLLVIPKWNQYWDLLDAMSGLGFDLSNVSSYI